MVQVELLRPRDVGAADRSAWRSLLTLTPEWNTPFLRPGFADAVGDVRDDALVAIYRKGAAVVGVLPFHLRPGRFARPLGAPFSDRHALIAAPDQGLDLQTALSLAGLSALRFTGLADPNGASAYPSSRPDVCAIADLSAGAQTFFAERTQAHKRFYKTLMRHRRKAEEDFGPVVFTYDDRDPETFETLITWKRAQYRASGLTDVFAPAWSQALMRSLFDQPAGEVRGVLSTLKFGDRLAAAEFNLVGGGAMQGWIVAYDRAFAACSPGQQVLSLLLEQAPAHGVTRYDLGGGGGDYKKYFSNRQEVLFDGLVASPTTIGRIQGLGSTSARMIEARGAPRLAAAAGRAMRRFDQIAALEPSLFGRTRSVVDAIAGLQRRAS